MTKILVTAAEAADMLSIGVTTIRELVDNGTLERRYIGKGRAQYRIPVTALEAYAESLPREPVAS